MPEPANAIHAHVVSCACDAPPGRPEVIEQADAFAAERHAGQDYSGRPYIVHPRQVAALLQIAMPQDVNLIAAGLLHDTLEDTSTTYNELLVEFGEDIAERVLEVTHFGKPDDHGYYFPYLRSRRGIILKFADRLANLANIDAWSESRQAQYLRRSVFWRSA